MTENLSGKGVLITGGTTGIGRATGIELASQGAKVFVYGRHEKELKEGLAAIREAGETEGCIADQTKREDVLKAFTQAKSYLGRIDFVIANAAIAADDIKSTDNDDWRYAIETNLVGYLEVSKQAIEAFGDQGGILVLIGSIAADGEEGSSVYSAAKGGIRSFATSLRKEVAEQNIRVVLVEPGAVGSDMQEPSPEEQRQKIAKSEMLKAEDVAELIAFILTRPERCTLAQVRIEPRIEKG